MNAQNLRNNLYFRIAETCALRAQVNMTLKDINVKVVHHMCEVVDCDMNFQTDGVTFIISIFLLLYLYLLNFIQFNYSINYN